MKATLRRFTGSFLPFARNLSLDYHEHEKCFYINPAETNKASTVKELCCSDYVAFGNDQNDIQLFKNSLYAVQVGDFSGLRLC